MIDLAVAPTVISAFGEREGIVVEGGVGGAGVGRMGGAAGGAEAQAASTKRKRAIAVRFIVRGSLARTAL